MKRFNDFLNEEAKDTTFQRLAKFQKRFEIIVDDPPEGEEENEYQENEKYQLIFDLVDDFNITIEELNTILNDVKNTDNPLKYEYETYIPEVIKELEKEANPADYRKPGFYKVKFKDGEWSVAKFSIENEGKTKMWEIIASDEFWYARDENELFSYIAPNPIIVKPY